MGEQYIGPPSNRTPHISTPLKSNTDFEATIAQKWDNMPYTSKSRINTIKTDQYEGAETSTGNMTFNIRTDTIKNDTGDSRAVTSNNTIIVGY